MALPELDRVRAKFPQYNDLDDATLATKLAQRYPEYQDLAQKAQSSSPDTPASFGERVAREPITSLTPVGLVSRLLSGQATPPATMAPRLGELPRVVGNAASALTMGIVPPERFVGNAPPIETGGGKLLDLLGQGTAIVKGAPGQLGRMAATKVGQRLPGLVGRAAGRLATGAVEGGLSDVSHPEQIPARAAVGAVAEGVVGTAGAAFGKAKEFVTPPARKGLAVGPKTIARMKPVDRKKVQAIQQFRETQRFERAKAGLEQGQQATMEQLKLARQGLAQKVDAASFDEVVKFRPAAQQIIKDHNDLYGQKIAKAVEQADFTVSANELEEHLAKNLQGLEPEAYQQGRDLFGLTQGEGQTLPVQALDRILQTPQLFTPQEILAKIDGLGETLNRQALAGGVSPRKVDVITNKLRGTLLDLLESRGVKGVREAKQFWREYTPYRRKLYGYFRPFLDEPIDTRAGQQFLERVAKGKRVEDEKLIEWIEEQTGKRLGGETKRALARLDVAKQAEAVAEVRRQTLQRELSSQHRTRQLEQKLQSLDIEQGAQRREDIQSFGVNAVLRRIGVPRL